jgi:hypothetical protein
MPVCLPSESSSKRPKFIIGTAHLIFSDHKINNKFLVEDGEAIAVAMKQYPVRING